MRLGIVTIVLIAVLAAGIWGPGPGASPDLGEGLAAAASESVAGSPGQHGRAPGACGEKEELGPVYMYGELVEKPYVFSNVGGDTLYLNGVPYDPIRGPVPPSESDSELVERLAQQSRGRHAFRDSVSKVVRAMHDTGATYEECLEEFAAMYDSSRFVVPGSVRKLGNGIYLQWSNGNDGTIGLSFEPGAPPRTKKEIHNDLVEEFWREVRAGNMIAKGYVDNLTYFIFSPRPDIYKINLLIKRLAAGDTLSEEDVAGTPLIDDLFRMDVSRRVSGTRPKEE